MRAGKRRLDVPTRTKDRKRPRSTKQSVNQRKTTVLNRAFPNSNVKYWDYYQSPIYIVSGSAHMFAPLDGLVRGTSGKTFVGNQIRPIAIELRYEITPGGNNGNPNLRFILMQATDGTFNIPVLDAAMVLEDANKTSTPFQFEFKDSILVHRDVYLLTNVYQGVPLTGKIYVKGKKLLQVQYTDAGAISMGRIFVICSSSSTTTLTAPQISYYIRVYFRDNI